METISNYENPEFTLDVPSKKDIELIVQNYQENRFLLSDNADSWGLNKSYLQGQDNTCLVGPFISPAPLPTSCASSADNIRTTMENGMAICDALKEKGITATQALIVTLALSEMPRKGSGVIDCLIAPKNNDENQRIRLVQDIPWQQAYQNVQITSDDILRTLLAVDKSSQAYQRRTGYPKGLVNRCVTELSVDLLEAGRRSLQGSEKGSYLSFATALNQKYASELFSGKSLPIIPVDITMYDGFLRYGIEDMSQFIQTLNFAGFFESDPAFIKGVDAEGIVQIYSLSPESTEGNIRLVSPYGLELSYDELLGTYDYVAPCKELSYLMTLGQMVPVVYGDENRGTFYKPYADAKRTLDRLGLRPTMYRIQPLQEEDILRYPTFFEYYKKVFRDEYEYTYK